MKKKQRQLQCFISSKTVEHFGYPDRWNQNYKGVRPLFMAEIVVDDRGKMIKSRHTRSNKRFTAKDVRNFEGVIFRIPFDASFSMFSYER